MASILGWETRENGTIAKTGVSVYDSPDDPDTVNLHLTSGWGDGVEVDVAPKFARELARDLNAAAKACEK